MSIDFNKQPASQEDIIYLVSEETGYSKEHIKIVVKQFWNSVRYYITHPLESKKGILLQPFFKFFIRKYNTEQFLKRFLEKQNGNITPKVEFYQKLLKQL